MPAPTPMPTRRPPVKKDDLFGDGSGYLPPARRAQTRRARDSAAYAYARADAKPRTRVAAFLALAGAVLALLLLFVLVRAVRTAAARSESMAAQSAPETTTQLDGLTVPLYENVARCSWPDDVFTLDEATGRITSSGADTGVDVSSHQGSISWPDVAADGITWASLRIGRRGYTEGGLVQDETFEANYAGAVSAGLEVGVYFYAQSISVEEAREEAAYVLQLLNGRALQCPVVFDWEDVNEADARTRNVDNATLTAMANAFCEDIRAAGYDTAVYTNRYMAYNRFQLPALDAGDAVWLASYGEKPGYYYDFAYWQYSHTGSVAGIGKNVDLNLRMPA